MNWKNAAEGDHVKHSGTRILGEIFNTVFHLLSNAQYLKRLERMDTEETIKCSEVKVQP